MKLRIGQVVVALLMVAAFVWLAPTASAEAAISGRVTDTSAHALQGIEVCALTEGPFGSSACTQTDASGEYTLPGAGAGYLVQFYSRENQAPGYAPQWYPGKAHSDEAVAVEEADVGHVDAEMALGGTVTGTVRSLSGSAPIEGVEVCPVPTVFEDHGVTFCDRSDANGEYALRGLGTGEYRFEFRTDGEVNFVETTTEPFPVHAGSGLVISPYLRPGVMVKGTVTEAGTGLPVEGLGAPYSTPRVCAHDSATEEPVKCTTVGPGGHYALPGLKPGEIVGVSFALDIVEEGLDLHPDGYVRQYYDQVPTWNEATFLFGNGGVVFSGTDAVLTRGAEVFPHCEVASACPPAAEPGPPGRPVGESGSQAPVLPPALASPVVHCPKGYLKVERIAGTKCFKVHKKKHHRKHRAKHRHKRKHRHR